MKIGMRKSSLKKSFKARTTGKLKRKIKKKVIPGYGKKGMGILHPKKALYNKVYRKTTFGGISGINQSYSGKSKTIQYEYHEVFLKEHRVNKLAYCLLAFFLGSIGGQYFYMKEFKKGLLCFFLSWTTVPIFIGFYQAIKAIFEPFNNDDTISIYTK